ncbi:UNVERIFIED_CONTAM: hypothetical protein Slati_2674100 [Sesamum latifolium]|uniref:CCHC-type domain-containing protein n=1 Tax=Sesamum latifolium TaxID=2727402 RepID=A0AAW2VW61_9LAMI
MKKLPSEAFDIIDKIATNLYSYGQERTDKRTTDIHSIDVVSALSAQMTALTHKVDNLGVAMWNGAPIGPCGACGQMRHWSQDCKVGNQFSIHEDANFVSHDDRSNFNPYSNTYSLGWRSHPNFSWSNNQQQGPARPHQPRQPPPQEPKSNLEDMFSKFITATDTRFQNQDARLQSQEASIRNIEVQIRQLVSIVSGRKEGQLPSDTKKNSREQVNAIFVRNERAIGDERPKEQVEEAQAQKEEESQEKTKGSPLKLNLDMSSSAKFLKEVLSTKRKWEGCETVKLNEECSAILQNKLPPKLKNPGSFSIPCTIGNVDFDKVLCDLDMEEDKNMPLILGKPFLATSRALIDVQKYQLTLRVNDEHVVFNMFRPMKYLHKKEHDIFAMDNINTFGTDNVHLVKCDDPKEDCIENSNEDNLQDMKEEHEEVLNFVDTGQEVKSKLQKELLLIGSTSNLKVKPPFETSSDRKKGK